MTSVGEMLFEYEAVEVEESDGAASPAALLPRKVLFEKGALVTIDFDMSGSGWYLVRLVWQC